MIEIDHFVKAVCNKIPQGLTFQPSDTNLTEYFRETRKTDEEENSPITLTETEKRQPTSIHPKYPLNTQVIAVDSTLFTLGQIPDGLVGAVRASIITKAPGKTSHSLEKYGPYMVPITNQNKETVYKNTFKTIYGKENESTPPDCYKTIEHVRSWLERYIQTQIVQNSRDSLILLDGSLIGGTIGDPMFVLRKILSDATANGNTLVAISKSTGLTLQRTMRNILSLLDGVQGPCYIGNIKKHITQDIDRYFGEIYVAKLTTLGEPFRIDIPKDSPVPHDEVFAQVAGLAGDYGYPEELRLAHMTCVLSSIEILELQAAAIALHGLSMKEELRAKIFPL
jgi:hypothetical protein